MTRRRLDAELVRRGLAGTRTEARAAVEAGNVQVAGTLAHNAATMVADDAPITLTGEPRPFVSRAGSKLDAALDRFGVDVIGYRCLDAGASTGGFTDVLLRRGAASVLAVDVGYGQLAWELRTDPRVTVLERTNVRALTPQVVPALVDLVVADLSFISLRVVLPALRGLATPEAPFLVLVKPQFEASKDEVGAGGVVREPHVWARVLDNVVATAEGLGLGPRAAMASPLLGPAGNVEFLVQLGPGAAGGADLAAALDEGMAMRS